MARRKRVAAVKPDDLEGFVPPPPRVKVVPREPAAFGRDGAKVEERPYIPLMPGEVPEHMRLVKKPELDTRVPGRAGVNASSAAIEKMLARTRERRIKAEIERISDPGRRTLIAQLRAERSAINAPKVGATKVEEKNDGSEKGSA